MFDCELVVGWWVDGVPATGWFWKPGSSTSITRVFTTPGGHSAGVRASNFLVPDLIFGGGVDVQIVHSIEAIAPFEFSESDGEAAIVVERTHLAGPATIHYETVDDTLHAGVSFAAVSGTLSFADGEWQKTVVVPLIDDSVFRTGHFQLQLSSPSAGYVLRNGGRAFINVADNEPIPAVTVQFSAADYVIHETDKTFALPLTLSSPTELIMPVNIQVSSADDLLGINYLKTEFQPGQTAATLEGRIGHRSCYLDDETLVTVRITQASPYILANTATATLHVLDAESAPTLLVEDVSVPEGNWGSSRLSNIRLDGATPCYVMEVEVALADVTTDSDDLSTGSRTYRAEQLTDFRSLFEIIGDLDVESDEQFTVTVTGFATNPRQGLPLVPHPTATVTILNDDAEPSLQQPAPSSVTVEGGLVQAVPLTFSVPVSGVDLSDFALVETNVAGSALVSVAPGIALAAVPASHAAYEVKVLFGHATGAGGGTVRLRLLDDDTIVDEYGRPLGGTGAGNGSVVLSREYAVTANSEVPIGATALIILCAVLAAVGAIRLLRSGS